jgi:hypothetical protein
MSEELVKRNIELRLEVLKLNLEVNRLIKSEATANQELATWKQIAIAAVAKAEALERQRFEESL